jgi:membrane associated rhomboid family serine protease
MSNVIWREIRSTFQRRDRMIYQLILVNVAVFLAIGLARVVLYFMNVPFGVTQFSRYLGVPADLKVLLHQPWTLITYMFTHFDLLHILFNLLIFFWFGKILSEFAGNKKILPVYLLGGLSGALLYVAAYNVFPVFHDSVGVARAFGASAGVMAIVFAATTLVPDYTMFLFLFGAVRIKWIALALVVIDIISIPSSNAGGHIAHLGGALFGFFYVRQLQRGKDPGSLVNWAADRISNLVRKKPDLKVTYRRKEKTTVGNSYQQKNAGGHDKQQKLDTILDKISQSGYESLSKEEKDFLFRMSKEE